MTVGDRIKMRRKDLGLSAEDITNSLNISRATLYRYESNEIEKLPVTILEPLAKVLRTSPAYLMGWEDSPEETPETSPVPLHSVTLRPDEAALLGSYNKLNDTGKEKAVEYVTDLAGNKKYTTAEGVGRMSS